MLPADGGLLRCHGKLVWGGALERAAEPLIAALATALDEAWRPEGWAELLRAYLGALDRSGAFAFQLREAAGLRTVQALQHPDLASLNLAIESLLRLYQPAMAAAGLIIDGDAGDQQIDGLPLHWTTLSRTGEVLLSRAAIPVETTVIAAAGAVEHEALAQDCLAVAQRLRVTGAPAGEVALCALELRLDRWLSRWATSLGLPHGEPKPLSLGLVVMSDGQNRVLFESAIPLEALALANNALGLGPSEWVRLIGR
jgi:hypothetical protein